MIDMTKWKHKEEWHQRGNNFLVVVKRHTKQVDEINPSEVSQCWCVYAYIYPEHLIFEKFEGDSMCQAATDPMPLHGGCSYLQWHRDANGNPTSVQVGADYNHLYDEEFTHYATPEDAYDVFRDADALFQHLSK